MTDVARVLRCAAKLIVNLEAARKRSQETKVAKEPGEEIMTKAPPEGKISDNPGPEELIEPRAPVEENTVTKARTETPREQDP